MIIRDLYLYYYCADSHICICRTAFYVSILYMWFITVACRLVVLLISNGSTDNAILYWLVFVL